jgi:hypothetical protein
MPKIYTEEVMQLVWQAVTEEQKPLRKIAAELDSDMPTINLIYEAAKKRFHQKQVNEKKRNPIRNKPSIVQKTQRPPAIYSNRSPYGIARPGLK